MIACTSPRPTDRSTPLRIALSSSSRRTWRFSIFSMIFLWNSGDRPLPSRSGASLSGARFPRVVQRGIAIEKMRRVRIVGAIPAQDPREEVVHVVEDDGEDPSLQ